MLPLSALPATAAPNPGADLPAGQPGSSAEGADFLALLTRQAGDAAAAALPVDAAPGAAIMANAVSDPAAALPATGKILPPGLPLLPQGSEMLPDDAVPPPEPQPAAPPPVAIAVRLGQLPLARLIQHPRAADPEAAAPQTPAAEAEFEVVDLAMGEDLPGPAPAAAPQQAMVLTAPAPLPPLPEGETAEADAPPTPAAPRAQPLPVLAAAPQSAPAQLQIAVQTAQPQAAPQGADAPLTVLPTAAPPPAQLLAPAGDTAPRVAANLRVSLTARTEQRDEPVLPASAADAVLPGAAPQAPAALAAPAPLAPAAPMTRPHDFGALVDRLVAAREAMQPQAVSIAVRHADFGPVQLHFRQDDGALSVQLASPDPDFARAVSQAIPPVQAAQNADSAALNQHAARQDQSGSALAEGNGQQRGQQQAAQRDERGVRANPAPRQTAARDSEQGGQQGIFA